MLHPVHLHPGFYRLAAPEDDAAKGYALHLGLWVLKGRRILPAGGTPDLRVHLGTITFAADGTLTLRE